VLRQNGFAENFIVANPQFSAANLYTNASSNNYHSLQAQVSLRQTHGVSGQLTYTWSKNLGFVGYATGPAFTDPVNRRGDYTLVTGDRTHDLRANGAFALPIGPSKLLLSKTHGVVGRIVEGWQVGWVADLSSGVPLSIAAQNMLYANGTADIVGPFDLKSAGVKWGTVSTSTGQLNGSYFDPAKYKVVKDPQCAAVAANLSSLCTLQAIADSSGNIVLQNPKPGTRGNLGQNVIQNPGQWSLNTSMSKSFHVREQMNFRFRVDATNLLNHPTPANPNLNINSTTATFGNIATKTGNRTIQGILRLEF